MRVLLLLSQDKVLMCDGGEVREGPKQIRPGQAREGSLCSTMCVCDVCGPLMVINHSHHNHTREKKNQLSGLGTARALYELIYEIFVE